VTGRRRFGLLARLLAAIVLSLLGAAGDDERGGEES
jgi:hypothetical protein